MTARRNLLAALGAGEDVVAAQDRQGQFRQAKAALQRPLGDEDPARLAEFQVVPAGVGLHDALGLLPR